MSASTGTDNRIDFRPDAGVLRTRLVAALAGVSQQQLWRWHQSGLLAAHTLPGGPGVLRLYSWIDYMKARAARKLLDAGVKPKRLKEAIAYLEAEVPEWYFIPLQEFSGRVLLSRQGLMRTASIASQQAMPEIVFMDGILNVLEGEGTLGVLHSFSDVIEMDPRILGGNPVFIGTRLETRFIAELASRGAPPHKIAKSYRLSEYQIERAIAFTDRIAA